MWWISSKPYLTTRGRLVELWLLTTSSYINRTELVQLSLRSMACGWANPLKNECSSRGVIIPFLWLKINVSTCFQRSSRTCALNGWKDEKRMRVYFRRQKPKIRNCNGEMWTDTAQPCPHEMMTTKKDVDTPLPQLCYMPLSTMGGKKTLWFRSNRSINLPNLDKQFCQQLGWIWVTRVP